MLLVTKQKNIKSLKHEGQKGHTYLNQTTT